MYLKKLSLYIFLLAILQTSCKKLIEVDPPIREIVGGDIYNSAQSAAAVLTGMYTDMSNYGIFTGTSSLSVRAGVSADELVAVSAPNDILGFLYTNTLTNNGSQLFWTPMYAYIFRANAAIEGIEASEGLTSQVKQQLLGEAKFIRAFVYFYLVNLYGDVPLLLTTDININSTAPRTPAAEVYQQIITDLTEARENLNEQYVGADAVSIVTERVRPNKSAASVLLARAYLYTGQWQLAEEESNKIIENQTTYALEAATDVFVSTSREAVWQLQPVVPLYQNTLDAPTFVLKTLPEGPNGERPVYLSRHIINAFEPNDMRRQMWTDSVIVDGNTYPFAYKYKVYEPDQPRTEFLIVLRLAEQYLIRAEARAQQGKITGPGSAEEDLNSIRTRAGLAPTIASEPAAMLDAILHERQVELFTEWGHRWLDLKRTGKINEVMSVVTPEKGGVWEAYKSLYPIPIEDIQRNLSLKGRQNPGYPEL